MRTVLFIIQKEFIQVFRNKTMLPIIFVVPLVQLIILVNAATFEMKNISRAKEESETAGMIKLLVDAETDHFLGFAMVGIEADEILHIFTNFMAAKGTARTMKEALPAHPCVAEFFPTILGKLKPLQ